MSFISTQFNKVRAALKPLAPHFLTGFLADYREFKNTKRYASWSEAQAAASNDYEDDVLVRFRIARALANKDQEFRCEILHLCIALLGQDLEVTDFGGAVGYHGEALCREFPNVRYTVVETPSMVQHSPSLNSRLNFQTSIPKQCDVFFTSCALPYLADPMGVLREGFSSARKLVILARNSFCDEEIFRVQTSNLFANGSGRPPPGFEDQQIRYPHRSTMPKQVIELADSLGFRLSARLFDPHDQSGFVPYHYRSNGGTLTFVRRT
jgi:putative methyltransferase (TIGR04325 family)